MTDRRPAPSDAGRGTSRAPSPRVRTLPVRTFAAALVVAALAAPAGAARAQLAGVPNPPRVRRPPAADPRVAVDSATRAAQTSAQTPERQRTRLDIQAWVDSAAGALARTPPAPIPPPGGAGRPSIFATPAVPDSLRPPPAGTAGGVNRPGAERARRSRRPAARPRS